MNNRLEKIDSMPVKKAILTNAIPAMIAMIMVLIYNMADLFFVGQTGDPLQVAAVSIATPLFLIFMSLGNIFGIGGTSFLSRTLGSGNKDLAKKISSFCFWSCIVIGVVVSAIVFFAMDSILRFLGASEDIWSMVENYLQLLCLSGPFILISSCFSNLLRGEGQAGKSMLGMLIGNLVNIVLDPIFILGFGMGVEGAAIATVIGNICGGLYYIFYLLKGNTILSTNFKDFSTSNGIVSNVLGIGIPASLSTILMSISQMIFNGQMAKYGDLALAGIGIAMKVTMITSMLCIGLGQGVQPLLGYVIGARNKKRYNEIMKFSLLFAFALSGVLTIGCYIGLEQIVGGFLSDVAAFDYALSFSKILLSTSILFGILFVLSNALQAAGAATASLIVNVSRQGLVYIPMVYILNAIFGIDGLVFAQPIADVSALVLALIFYVSVSKKVFSKNIDVDNDRIMKTTFAKETI